LFRKFVDTPGTVEITAKGVIVRLKKRAHNPLLKEAGLMRPTRAVPRVPLATEQKVTLTQIIHRGERKERREGWTNQGSLSSGRAHGPEHNV